MATSYAIQPQAGVADILNQASDDTEKSMESSRRSALTGLEMQGAQQRMRLADSAEGRAQESAKRDSERFVSEQDRLKFEGEERTRDRTLHKDVLQLQQDHLMEDVADASGNKTRQPVDLTSPKGLASIASFQAGLFSKRAAAGKVDQNEINSMVAFRDGMEKKGYLDDFKKALGGDPAATTLLVQKLGLDPGTTKIGPGFDKSGVANIYAFTTTTANGKTVTNQSPIGHLAAMFAPEVYGAYVEKPQVAKTAAVENTYKGKLGDAATTNAAAAMLTAKSRESGASAKIANSDAYKVFTELESKSKGYFAPGFTSLDAVGKPQSVKDDEASNLVHQFGAALIEKDGFSGGQALNQARSMIGSLGVQAKKQYDAEFAKAKADLQTSIQNKAKPEDIKKAKTLVNDMEEKQIQLWQGYRQVYVDRILAAAAAAPKAAPKPAPKKAIP